jgi:hypothetical protein
MMCCVASKNFHTKIVAKQKTIFGSHCLQSANVSLNCLSSRYRVIPKTTQWSIIRIILAKLLTKKKTVVLAERKISLTVKIRTLWGGNWIKFCTQLGVKNQFPITPKGMNQPWISPYSGLIYTFRSAGLTFMHFLYGLSHESGRFLYKNLKNVNKSYFLFP